MDTVKITSDIADLQITVESALKLLTQMFIMFDTNLYLPALCQMCRRWLGSNLFKKKGDKHFLMNYNASSLASVIGNLLEHITSYKVHELPT